MLRRARVQEMLEKLAAEFPDARGFSAAEIGARLSLQRNTVSMELNALAAEGAAVKQRGKPVLFLDIRTYRRRSGGATAAAEKHVRSGDAFAELLCGATSIVTQIEQAKAAILYPPNGLHTLIVGRTGVGKSYFAQIMYRYAKNCGAIGEDAPFITFNCADYAENPQLLNSQLFGHRKGAFTGAETDRSGLVEKAQDGYLFLDEVHNLSPEGQEMLFTLMDKRVYRRLGEASTDRSSNARIVCATTEDQKRLLLSTFLRRIPILIHLPPLENRSVSDRYLLVKRFFIEEANRTGRKIVVDKEVMNRLLFTEFSGNIGEMRSSIQLLCSRAFVASLEKREQVLQVKYLDIFDPECYGRSIMQIYAGLGTPGVNVDMTAGPGPEMPPDAGERADFYDSLNSTYQSLLSSGVDRRELMRQVNEEVAQHFDRILEQSHKGVALNLDMHKIVPQPILIHTRALAENVLGELHKPLSKDVLLGLALHAKAFVERSAAGKGVRHPSLEEVIREHPKEFALASRYVAGLCDAYKIRYSDHEAAFVSMFLVAEQARHAAQRRDHRVILLCHGDAVASSMAHIANQLLGEALVDAVDMPMDVRAEQVDAKLYEIVDGDPPRKGVLLLVDMGSLRDISQRMWAHFEKRLEIGCISGVNLPILLEAAHCAASGQHTLGSLVGNTGYRDSIQGSFFSAELQPRERVIWTCCMTGIGTAMKIRSLLDQALGELPEETCTIIAVNYMDLPRSLADAQEAPHLIVGAMEAECAADVPFVSLDELLQGDGIERILTILWEDCRPERLQAVRRRLVKYISLDSLMDTLVAIDPVKVVGLTQNSIEKLEGLLDAPFDQGRQVQLLVHMAFMVERLVLSKEPLTYTDVEAYIARQPELFETIGRALAPIQAYFNIAVPDSEKGYIADILIG